MIESSLQKSEEQRTNEKVTNKRATAKPAIALLITSVILFIGFEATNVHDKVFVSRAK